jgi:hypothetical protein
MWSAQAQLALFLGGSRSFRSLPGELPKLRFGMEERKLRLRTPHACLL